MRTILFLCSGNYYRSRFAEHYFNDLARRNGLNWLAISRGLAKECGITNVGAISPLVLDALNAYDVLAPETHRYPRSVRDDDLLAADMVIAVKESEHRPLMHKFFPSWEAHISYWHIHDLDKAPPDESLPLLASRIDRLLSDLISLTRIAKVQSVGYGDVEPVSTAWPLPLPEADAAQVWQSPSFAAD